MIVGVPREVKEAEHRVAIVPGGVEMLVKGGHQVYIEKGAGVGAGIPDSRFISAGAKIMPQAGDIWQMAEMIIKVKEPIASEYNLLKPRQILYTYLHLAAQPDLTEVLLDKEIAAIAYETIELDDHSLPLLTPMSEVAGRMAVQAGAQCLEKRSGGKGLLLGGVPGVRRGRVAIIGGGVAGINAAKVAIGLGAQVTILDINPARLSYLDDVFGNNINTLMSNPENISSAVQEADLVIGAVLVTGAKAPVLVSEEMIKTMEAGSVVVDVAIDQGGCFETSRATSHLEPVFELHGILHYCVANIPGGVPQTSTYAMTNVTMNYAQLLANSGLDRALAISRPLQRGLNTHNGVITHEAVAKSLPQVS